MGLGDESTLFLVRVWRDSAEGFRAAARPVDGERAEVFTEAAALARFLAAPCEPAVNPAPHASGVASGFGAERGIK